MKMTLQSLLWRSCIAVMTTAPVVPATAATANECVNKCVPGKPTAASYTWNFKGEANAIFMDVQADARRATSRAARLQSFTENPNLSWETHASQLQELKSDINELGTKLCRLETIRRVLAPWQQREVDQIATTVRLMADNAQDAIVFVNDKPDRLWVPAYRKYVNNLYSEAHDLAHSVQNAVAYANVSREYRDLKLRLGVNASS
jgi:hypothetical protein